MSSRIIPPSANDPHTTDIVTPPSLPHSLCHQTSQDRINKDTPTCTQPQLSVGAAANFSKNGNRNGVVTAPENKRPSTSWMLTTWMPVLMRTPRWKATIHRNGLQATHLHASTTRGVEMGSYNRCMNVVFSRISVILVVRLVLTLQHNINAKLLLDYMLHDTTTCYNATYCWRGQPRQRAGGERSE